MLPPEADPIRPNAAQREKTPGRDDLPVLRPQGFSHEYENSAMEHILWFDEATIAEILNDPVIFDVNDHSSHKESPEEEAVLAS